MIQRQTQTSAYWGDAFAVEEADLEHLYNLLLEGEMPLTTDDLVTAVVRRRCEREEQLIQRQGHTGALYLPQEAYQPGQTLLFPALSFSSGAVTGVRPGHNPSIGEFDVIAVDFGDGRPPREFAARLTRHSLNEPPAGAGEDGDGTRRTAEQLAADYSRSVGPKLEARLKAAGEVVRIAGRWFPRALLVDVNVGHLNLAEAVLDMAGGGPRPPEELLPQIGLPTTTNSQLQVFSLNYALQEDQRFDEVGPAGQVQWFLRRLEPPEVLYPPRRLQLNNPDYDPKRLPPNLPDIERELDDEFSPLAEAAEAEETTIILTFPHRRVGTLPISARLTPLFPTAYESPRIRFILIDGHTGDQMPGWVVREQRFVFGLDEWYARNEIPVGAYIGVRRGDRPGEVVVNAKRRRPVREWVRTLIPMEGRLTFGMQKRLIACEYDELMVIASDNPAAVDDVWLKSDERRAPFYRIVADVFRELAKLNPQSAVHVKALYSAVNVLRRCTPGPILAELATRPYFVHVGDLYWRFDESRWSE